jgi:hypothetical protein
MGVVYAAHDRERDEEIAAKTLLWADPMAIYGLKHEFRTLAGLVHPNLVNLYELIGTPHQWFFTMELVDGVDFRKFARPADLQVDRLRHALTALTEGVAFIHAAGKLHRDLKPQNVLVTSEGRVVILDFGIAADVASSLNTFRATGGFAGTFAYVAPEQIDGESNPGSDWYALGVMLYEALTGQLPYSGHPLKYLVDKQTTDARFPAGMKGLPSDLVELSLALMTRDPAGRPGEKEILDRIARGRRRAPLRPPREPSSRTCLVGRELELSELQSALDSILRGEAFSLYVIGSSGIGKTALVRHFLDRLTESRAATVLQGRCYVRESMPYKGFDGVIDSLSRLLLALEEQQLCELLFDELHWLVRVFPVLERVKAIARLPHPGVETVDPVQRRREAFGALRELLQRLSESQPVVIYIDDLQWAGDDTVALLEELLAPPTPPPILVISGFRPEDVQDQYLGALLESAAESPSRSVIQLEPLAESETRRLAERLWEGEPGAQAPLDSIVAESGGSPFLIEQLARHGSAPTRTQGRSGLSLHEMLESRISRFPRTARPILEALAVAAQPLSAIVARDVAGIRGDERPLVRILSSERILRTTGDADHIEFYHDRIRESMAAAISERRAREIHLRLARFSRAHGVDDPEILFEHYREAGETEIATKYAEEAGNKAASALAFQRAVAFYRHALATRGVEGPATQALRRKLADALANAGRGPEAADVYLEAADIADGPEVVDLQRLAAEQLLRTGHVDRGLGVLDRVLAAVRLRLAGSPRHALVRILTRRLRLRLRGLRFRPRPEANTDSLLLRRIDVCWATSIGLARIDTIRAMDFQTLGLLLSLRSRDPFRIVRAVAAEASFVATSGQSRSRRARRLVETAREVATGVDKPEAHAFAEFSAGMVAFWLGRFAEGRTHCEIATDVLRRRCTGVVWEVNTSQTFTTSCLVYLGEYGELARRLPVRLREAREAGDLYAAADCVIGRPILVWLLNGNTAETWAAVREAKRPWDNHPFQNQHYFTLLSECQLHLYEGNGLGAWERIAGDWPSLKKSLLLRTQVIRMEAIHLRARCALAALLACRDEDRQSWKKDLAERAEKDARRLTRSNAEWVRPLGWLVYAALASRESRVEARELLSRAVPGFAAATMKGYEAAARYRHGQLARGVEGEESVRIARTWLRSEGAVSPARIVDVLAPGFVIA